MHLVNKNHLIVKNIIALTTFFESNWTKRKGYDNWKRKIDNILLFEQHIICRHQHNQKNLFEYKLYWYIMYVNNLKTFGFLFESILLVYLSPKNNSMKYFFLSITGFWLT